MLHLCCIARVVMSVDYLLGDDKTSFCVLNRWKLCDFWLCIQQVKRIKYLTTS